MWAAFDRLEPFGDERHDRSAAIIACTIFNINRGKGVAAMKPSDFMIEYDKPEQTAAQLEIGITAWANAMNASQARKK